MERRYRRDLWRVGVAALLVLAYQSDAVSAEPDDWSRLAYSRDDGVEVMVRLRDGEWCNQALELRLIAEQPSVFTAKNLQPLIKSLSDLVRRDCRLVRYFAIAGLQKGSSEKIYRAEAAYANAWFIVELQTQTVTPEVQRKSRPSGGPPMTAEQRKHVEELQLMVRGAAKAKSEAGKIVKIQKVLKELGFYKGPLTGKMSDASSSAIKDFKKFHGLKPTVAIDDEFLEVLHDPRALLGQKYVKPGSSRS